MTFDPDYKNPAHYSEPELPEYMEAGGILNGLDDREEERKRWCESCQKAKTERLQS